MPAGIPWPFGVQWVEADDSFNFALYSKHATGVTLLCYTEEDPVRPVLEYRFRHPGHKTGNVWHCRIPASELLGATLYAYRVDGPQAPEHGHRFDPQKVLLDPYAPSVFFPPAFSRDACAHAGPTDGRAPLGRLPGKRVLALPADVAPRHTCRDAIVYELHVKGFTARANSGVTPSTRGTFAGVARRHGRRASPGPPVRSAGGQLLGLHDVALLLAPSPATRTATPSKNSGRWCRPFTRRASRCGSTWSTTTWQRRSLSRRPVRNVPPSPERQLRDRP